MLNELKERLRNAVNKILGKTVIDEKAVKEFIKEMQKGLILSDVNVKIVLEFSRKIEEKILKSKPPSGIPLRDFIIKTVYEELTSILGGEKNEYIPEKGRLNKVLLVGIEGSGKTTTAAKLAMYYRRKGFRVGLLSIDTYRPAARIQLQQLAEKINVDFFDIDTNNPIELASKGLKYFQSNGYELVIIDTAGRHKDEKSLMEELQKISELIKPDFTFLVIDASIGQQAYNQAKAFNETVKIGGIIITKMDGTAKGGGALSAAVATGAKVYFLGTGEKIEDLEEYNPKGFVSRLLGLGDLGELLKRVEMLEISAAKKKKLEAIAKGKFTLVDMIEQLQEIRKLGSLSKLLDLIPGLSMKIPADIADKVEEKIEKWQVIINSMTDEEKIDPLIVKGSRLKRISRGSGVNEQTIKEMIKQYIMLRKMMRSKQGKRLLKTMIGKKGLRGVLGL